ncbi:MAG: glycosyltransferase family 2 protein [Candidatus Bathyarchaeota archaeon]|nr:glycosyltransferase family 2 protein [Candidatus Bathyarchaeota archaeon]
MVKRELISIIIPTYNRPEELERTLKTIFNQSYRNFELIIVDDGSKSDISHLAKKYPLQIIRQEHSGANVARNNGFQHSKGELLLFSDDDIRFKPSFLEKLVKALETNPEKSYAYCGLKIDGEEFGKKPFNPNRLKRQNYINTVSLIRRSRFPGWDPKIMRFQDWDLWLTMLERGDHGILVPEYLFSSSRTSSIISNDSVKGNLTHLEAYEAVRKKHKLPDFAKPISTLAALYYSREDLREAFPEAEYGDFCRLLIWATNVVTKKINDSAYHDLIQYKKYFQEISNFEKLKLKLGNSLA